MTDLYRKQARNLGCPSNQDWMSCTANGFYMLYKDKDYSAGDRDRIANLQQFCKVCKALDATDIPDRYVRHDADGNLRTDRNLRNLRREQISKNETSLNKVINQ